MFYFYLFFLFFHLFLFLLHRFFGCLTNWLTRGTLVFTNPSTLTMVLSFKRVARRFISFFLVLTLQPDRSTKSIRTLAFFFFLKGFFLFLSLDRRQDTSLFLYPYYPKKKTSTSHNSRESVDVFNRINNFEVATCEYWRPTRYVICQT